MLPPPIALLLAAAVLPGSNAQDPAVPVDEKVFWSAVPRAAKPVPPPIVPQHWLVVPKETNASVAQVFTRHLLDQESPAPAVAGDGLAWKAIDSKRPAGIVAAFTHITSERDEVRMARLTGAELLFVNGDPFVGDMHDRKFRGVPVPLKKGENSLFVLGVPDSFEVELWVPQTRTVLAHWDVAWPGENPVADDISYPIFNASLAAVECVHVHYGHAVVEGGTCRPSIGEWRDGGRMLPLGLFLGGSYFSSMGIEPCEPESDEQAALVPICVYADDDSEPDNQIMRRAPASERKQTNPTVVPPRTPTALLGSPLSALSTDVLLVFPRNEAPERARFDQQLCWYRAWFVPQAISGEDLVSIDPGREAARERAADSAWGRRNVVVYGNAESNPAWSRFVPEDSPIQVHRGSLSVNGTLLAGEDICGWFRFTAKSGKRCVVAASTGESGERLGCLVQPLFAPAGEFDYCFWDARGANGTPRVIASGKLDAKPNTAKR